MSQTFSKKKLQVADSTLVNFFEMKKFSFQKKMQVWDQTTNQIPNFFEMKKISFQKKIQVWDLIGALIPHLYFFFEIKKISFSKKLQVLDQVHFEKIGLDQPTLDQVIF